MAGDGAVFAERVAIRDGIDPLANRQPSTRMLLLDGLRAAEFGGEFPTPFDAFDFLLPTHRTEEHTHRRASLQDSEENVFPAASL